MKINYTDEYGTVFPEAVVAIGRMRLTYLSEEEIDVEAEVEVYGSESELGNAPPRHTETVNIMTSNISTEYNAMAQQLRTAVLSILSTVGTPDTVGCKTLIDYTQ